MKIGKTNTEKDILKGKGLDTESGWSLKTIQTILRISRNHTRYPDFSI